MSKFEDVLEDLKELKTKPLEDFIKQFDLADYRTFDAKKRDEMIDYAIGVANQIKNSQDKIMTNYGHKISALEAKSPDNEKILPFLTSLDALKANYTNRENELIDKFKANGVDYTAFQKKEKSEEQIAASRGKIGELTSQLSALQADKSMSVDDRLKQINEISNQLVKANDELQRTVTENTYKELFKKELTDEFQPEVDEKSQRAIYETFSKDIKDFTQIQTAKEKLIDFYSKIINDESYAEKVAKKLVARNQDDEISNLFTVSGNVINNPSITKGETEDGEETEVVGKDNYEFEVGEAKSPESYREHYIKTGDVYQLNRKIYRDSAKGETYEMFEVIDTRTTANPDGSLKGEVRISNNKGYKEWLDIRDFKRIIKPMGNSADSPIKMDARSEEYQFYQKFKNRAIRFTKNGKTYIGKLSLPYAQKSKDGKGLFAKANTYDLLYLDENGKRAVLHGFKFDDTKSLKYEILNEDLSILLDLKLNIEEYLKVLTKTLDTIQNKSINNLKDKLKSVLEGKEVENLPAEITDLLTTNLEYQIANNEDYVASLQEAIKNLQFFEDVAVNTEVPIPQDVQNAIDKVQSYRESNKQLSENDTQKLLKEKVKALKDENDLLIQQSEEAINNITATLDPQTKEIIEKSPNKIEKIIELLNVNPEIRSQNSPFIDLYKQLLTKEIEYKTAINELNNDLYIEIKEVSND